MNLTSLNATIDNDRMKYGRAAAEYIHVLRKNAEGGMEGLWPMAYHPRHLTTSATVRKDGGRREAGRKERKAAAGGREGHT